MSFLLTTAFAAALGGQPTSHMIVHAEGLTWNPVAALPGVEAAVVYGDPSKREPFVMRIKLPAHYRVMPHTHPGDEKVTVLSGALGMAWGDTFDAQQLKSLKTGDFFFLPEGHPHYVLTSAPTVLEIHAEGPWGITFVNPDDDPRD